MNKKTKLHKKIVFTYKVKQNKGKEMKKKSDDDEVFQEELIQWDSGNKTLY